MSYSFKDMKNAQVSQGGVYVSPGNYLAEVQTCKIISTRKKSNAAIVEMKVLESDNPAHKVNSSFTWYVNLDNDAANGNIRNFVEAVTDESFEEVAAEEADAACDMVFSAANPFKGTKVYVTGINKPTKAGNDFTRVSFRAAK